MYILIGHKFIFIMHHIIHIRFVFLKNALYFDTSMTRNLGKSFYKSRMHYYKIVYKILNTLLKQL